jgi:hypothetical protein
LLTAVVVAVMGQEFLAVNCFSCNLFQCTIRKKT